MTFGERGKKNQNNILYRLSQFSKFNQFERLTKLQLSNTKRNEYTLFDGSTPYFNEHDLVKSYRNV